MPKIAWITSITAAVCATSSGTSTFWYTCSGPMVTHTFAATVRTNAHPKMRAALYASR